MSMASIIPQSRPSVSPKIVKHDEEVEDTRSGKVVKDDGDLIKERSPLADMLYLRCECCGVEGRYGG
jgi:hypothetical protein